MEKGKTSAAENALTLHLEQVAILDKLQLILTDQEHGECHEDLRDDIILCVLFLKNIAVTKREKKWRHLPSWWDFNSIIIVANRRNWGCTFVFLRTRTTSRPEKQWKMSWRCHCSLIKTSNNINFLLYSVELYCSCSICYYELLASGSKV